MSNREEAEERQSDAEALLRRIWQQQGPLIRNEADALVLAVYAAFLSIGCRGSRSDVLDGDHSSFVSMLFKLPNTSFVFGICQ